MSPREALRIVVFGATGALGQELIEQLAESDWPIAELVGVASEASAGSDLEFRGEALDVEHKWPVLSGRDLVFACTPAAVGLEVVREALRAEVPCVDCSGALASQEEIRPVFGGKGLDADASALESAPLLAMLPRHRATS